MCVYEIYISSIFYKMNLLKSNNEIDIIAIDLIKYTSLKISKNFK